MINQKKTVFDSTHDITKHACLAVLACGDLFNSFLQMLAPEQKSAIDLLVAAGGNVGLEFLANNERIYSIGFVVLQPDGVRKVVATMEPPVQPHGVRHDPSWH